MLPSNQANHESGLTLMRTTLYSIACSLNRRSKRWILRIIDLALFFLSIYCALSLRLDFSEAWEWIEKTYVLVLLIFPIKLICFSFIGVYRPVLKYMGSEFLSTVIIAIVCSSGLLALSGILLVIPRFPRSVYILDAIFTLLFVVGIRIAIRWTIYQSFIMNGMDRNGKENVLIYGAGEAGVQLMQSLSRDSSYKVVGFVDDNRQLLDQIVSGIKVHSTDKIPKLIEKYEIKSVLLAIPSLGKQRRRQIVDKLKHYKVQIKTIPGMSEIVSGKVSISEIKNIDIVDLLGRDEVAPDYQLLKKNVTNKSVAVTGAGGSIGAELCRQIAQLAPSNLILVERNEFNLYSIELELQEAYPDLKTVAYLGSVLNQDLLEKVFRENGVDTVYHAAAYKHVPLIESNIAEGVLNNIGGTLSAVKASDNTAVENFVLISTDKAVRPANVMGATKRIAEMTLQAFSRNEKTKTRFVMVRFGNVLDSAGSVVPRFRKQIEAGRNLTITHKEIKRYFMSIPEAARLVIQAGALGEGGEVFLLEMGEPVRIYDLAVQMIELSGLKLGEDIDIKVVGLRPGEKLFEELLIDQSKSNPTIHPKIFKADEDYICWDDLERSLDLILAKAYEGDVVGTIEELKKLVPEYRHHLQYN